MVIYGPLELKIHPKIGVENNAQTLPKQLPNNFEKDQKTTPRKSAKMFLERFF